MSASVITDTLAPWSTWCPFDDACKKALRLPGVYMAGASIDGPVVYVGMGGERRGTGVPGRLAVYSRGRAAVSGMGEAAMDRALADVA
jgi:hypothetical protein